MTSVSFLKDGRKDGPATPPAQTSAPYSIFLFVPSASTKYQYRKNEFSRKYQYRKNEFSGKYQYSKNEFSRTY
jgi:hypothetical protein